MRWIHKLTTGGAYVTGKEILFQRLLSRLVGKLVALSRSFVQFDGKGDAANARRRAIGGHPAVIVREYVSERVRQIPYANPTVTFRLESW